MGKTFFFYDLETSGLYPREDRIMQFAGQRTTMDLTPIGEPVNILVKMTDDALPSPGAINVTGITPQMTLADGVNEAEFCKFVTEEVFTPETCAVGYNTVRFDDEFMRAILWRNFHEPYEWQWKDGRSRWDMLDVVRMVRALRPEGIEWPVTEEGKATNRLELLTAKNGLSHKHAHDALSDVYATIAVARMIREKQPKLFDFLYKMRDKKQVKRLVNLEDKKPFVYVSGRYAAEYEKATVCVALTAGRNGNVLVYDLRYNLERVLAEPEFSDAGLEKTGSATRSDFYPIVKELCFNRCPAVAPLTVLRDEDWERIGLTQEVVEENLKILMAHPEFAEQMREQHENGREFPVAVEPEGALYDGFLNDSDRVKVAAVRNAEPGKLADFQPDFIDERLPELLLHYKGRNLECLSETEAAQYEEYRRARLERQVPKFLEELEKITDDFLREELLLYMQSLQ